MTYYEQQDVDKAGDRPVKSDSPEPEITPEMYLAGSRALEKFYLGDDVYDLQEDALAAIYRAMKNEAR